MVSMRALACLIVTMLISTVVLPAAQPSNKTTERVAFAQHCFWTGEMELGQIDGVVRTEAGYFKGREVTLVEYDPGRVSLERLVQLAKRAGVGDRVHLPVGSSQAGASLAGVTLGAPLDEGYRTAPASDQKKQLAGTPYEELNLSPEQATKVNAFVRVNPAKAREWLTVPQREKLTSAR
jgi:hypothetical protein